MKLWQIAAQEKISNKLIESGQTTFLFSCSVSA